MVHSTSRSRRPAEPATTTPSTEAASSAPSASPPSESSRAPCWAGDSPPPVWLPTGEHLARVPETVRRACIQQVQPFYDEYVARSTDPVERILSATVAHLTWLEILDQYEQRRECAKIDAVVETDSQRYVIIEQHLRLIDRKLKVANFLLRLREGRAALSKNAAPKPAAAGGQSRRMFSERPTPGEAIPRHAPQDSAPMPERCAPSAVRSAGPQSGDAAMIADAFVTRLEQVLSAGREPHEVRTLTQIAPPARPTGDKVKAHPGNPGTR